MLNRKIIRISVLLLSIFFVYNSPVFGQAGKKRYIDRKAIKLNISEMVLADIPIATRLGVSYEFLLDRSYGIQVGLAYLGYPIQMWGTDSMSRTWRDNVQQMGYNFDLAFRHYFDDADEPSLYLSTYFSTSRLWIDANGLPNVLLMKKDRVALVVGYQKKWRSLYFDMSGGLGVKIQNYQTHLKQTPFSVGRPSTDYTGNIGWNFEFNKQVTKLAIPIQFVVGFRF